MIDVTESIKNELIEGGAENVYSAFDALPVVTKGKYFTIVGMKKFEYSTPVFSQFTVYMPFRCEIEIKILAPENSSMEKLCQYYDSHIDGTVKNMSGLNCSISDMSVKHDKNVGRLVFSVVLSARGARKIEREEREEE